MFNTSCYKALQKIKTYWLSSVDTEAGTELGNILNDATSGYWHNSFMRTTITHWILGRVYAFRNLHLGKVYPSDEIYSPLVGRGRGLKTLHSLSI